MRTISIIAAMVMVAAHVSAQDSAQTPPIAPNIKETPLPPIVELPAPPKPSAEIPAKPLTADEAARIALHVQPSITAAHAGLEAALARTQQVKAGLSPVLAVSTGWTHQTTIAGAGSSTSASTGSSSGTANVSPGYSGAATLRQLVFDFEHTRDLVRQANALEKAQAANLSKAQSDLVFQVKQAFYSYVQAKRMVAVNEANVQNQQAHLALAKARLEAGLGLPSDVVRAQTAVSEAILNLNLAQNNASIARVNLAAIIGVDPRTPIETGDSDEPASAVNDMNALVGNALKQRPEVLLARATLSAAQYGVSAAKSGAAPSLSASLGISSRGTSMPPPNDSWTVGATISWNPFDSGLTAARVREQRANAVSAQASLQQAEITVTSDVSQAYVNLKTAEQRLVTVEAEVANAQEALRLNEGRYKNGLGQFLDVTDSQVALVTAQTNRINAQSAINQARAALNRAVGAPLPR